MDWNFLIRNKQSISVSTDTRNLKAGCVFFALKGEHFNGNTFAHQALLQGAEYVVVDEQVDVPADLQTRVVKVDNCLLALQDLARQWRRQWAKPILAITGTNGKTTTKELTAAVLSTKYHIHYTQGNLNNQVGVPLTLLQLNDSHEMAIVEMGASHPSDIRELVEIAEPDMGLITNVGKAHLLGFGSFEGVKKTKAELYDYLSLRAEQGLKTVVFRNLDNPHLSDMARQHLSDKVLTIGYHNTPMLSHTHLEGNYNAENIEAALTIGQYMGIDTDIAKEAVRAYIPKNNRSEVKLTRHKRLIIDAYNANPTSMNAAISSFLTTYHNDPCLFILGDMLELGEYSKLEHQNIVNMLAEQKQQHVMLVGNCFKQTNPPYPVFDTVEQLRDYVLSNPIEGYTILLKGSRGVRLEKIIDLL